MAIVQNFDGDGELFAQRRQEHCQTNVRSDFVMPGRLRRFVGNLL